MTRQEYTALYFPYARQITKGTGIFPETVMTVAITEGQGKNTSGNYEPGYSKLARLYNNHFGIKWSADWKGKTVNLDTGEFINEKPVNENAAFRVYNTPKESFKDFVLYLKQNPRYTQAGVFNAKTPQEQFTLLKQAGYATNPNYADLLNSVLTSISPYLTVKTVSIGIGGLLLGAAVLYFISTSD